MEKNCPLQSVNQNTTDWAGALRSPLCQFPVSTLKVNLFLTLEPAKNSVTY